MSGWIEEYGASTRLVGEGCFIQQFGGPDTERLGDLPQHQQGDVLHAPLDRADIGPIHPHAIGHRFLTKIGGETMATQIRPKEIADVHPQSRQYSRITALRIIIRGTGD